MEITRLKCLEPEDPGTVAQEAVIRATRAEVRDIEREHAAVVSRETYALVAAKRLEYFKQASLRVLRGIASPFISLCFTLSHLFQPGTSPSCSARGWP